MKSRYFLISVYVLISAIVALNPPIAKADIHVYDNNNQYLGIMTDMQSFPKGLHVFIPSLSGIFHITDDIDYTGKCDDEFEFLFDSGDCSGTLYSTNPYPLIFDFSTLPIGGFNKVDYNGKNTFKPGSYYDYDCTCQQTTEYPNTEYYPYVQVQIPFTTPIALPLRFEIRSKAVVIPLF